MGLLRSSLRILIVLPVRYPGGSAAANRMQKIARALRETGNVAKILAAGSPGENTPPNQWLRDEFSIDYRLVSSISARNPLKRLRDFMGESRLAAEADSWLRLGSFDCVFLYGQSWKEYSRLMRSCKTNCVPVIPDCTEWHNFNWDKMSFNFWTNQNLFRLLLLRKASGVVAISTYWEHYAEKLKKPVLLLPALGEAHAVAENEPAISANGEFEIVYVGGMAPRDLPLTLVEGLRIARSKGVAVRLCLIGKPMESQVWRNLQRMLCEDSNIRPYIEITGWVSEAELRKRMQRAAALVLLRPDSRETRACFPTRLPEYLLTGNPVIISDVGDIALYFTHKENAWLLPPGDQPEALADAFITLISNSELARGIGSAGKKTAIARFGYVAHAHRLAGFLSRIINTPR